MFVLVSEVPYSRQYHRHSQSIRRRNHLGVHFRTSGLDDCFGSGLGDFLDAVGKREKRVARYDRALQRQNCLLRADPCRIHAAHLPRANSDRAQVFSVENCV